MPVAGHNFKVVAIVQARMGSSRFPGKVLHSLGGRPVIDWILERLVNARCLDEVMVATSKGLENLALIRHLENRGVEVFVGSENDVLDRFTKAARSQAADIVVRITGDCPFLDPALVDCVVEALVQEGADYASNTLPPSFPDGLDVEACTLQALMERNRLATSPQEREHVTAGLRQLEGIRRALVQSKEDWSHLRLTLDYPDDAERLEEVMNLFAPQLHFSWEEMKLALEQGKLSCPEIPRHERNDGHDMSSSDKVWQRACRVIAGGNHLLSKHPDLFGGKGWPTYFKKTRGCQVWDLDDRMFYDCCVMGLGTNVLGYSHPKVDEAVRQVINSGNLSTLNGPEEVLLAEKLISMHPWSGKARFARTGGEAVAVAIRIARAASGKSRVAFCGYHGWHDWYLAANHQSPDNLNQHLIPGLDIAGVPPALAGSVLPFRYNRIDELEGLLHEYSDIGIIVMEPSRTYAPQDGFLEKVRELATQRGIVLVFDECSAGFRETFGGLHLKYGVDPDMAVFGKTLGNGYAITAILGTDACMDAIEKTFVSSTFWTERIGPAAALATLEEMEAIRSWEAISETGDHVRQAWTDLGEKHHLPVEVQGMRSLLWFQFKDREIADVKFAIIQEFLKRGFLATNALYVSTAHTEEVLSAYLENLDEILEAVARGSLSTSKLSPSHGGKERQGFARLN